MGCLASLNTHTHTPQKQLCQITRFIKYYYIIQASNSENIYSLCDLIILKCKLIFRLLSRKSPLESKEA